MMRLLNLTQVLALHQRIVATSGGSPGIRDLGALLSALSQPSVTFDGQELYPTLEEKAAALCLSLVSGHPFIDGNKRLAHAATEVFLVLNGHELDATVDEQEQLMLALASGEVSRAVLVDGSGPTRFL
ncbi:MAG: type II toxin-antitoxin system death-on-curing family toxin [Proteobacteria bacterium]|nr:type II toxin-antitoxin system death-on-curing family toxin [Pseudomonadota bacterium]